MIRDYVKCLIIIFCEKLNRDILINVYNKDSIGQISKIKEDLLNNRTENVKDLKDRLVNILEKSSKSELNKQITDNFRCKIEKKFKYFDKMNNFELRSILSEIKANLTNLSKNDAEELLS